MEWKISGQHFPRGHVVEAPEWADQAVVEDCTHDGELTLIDRDGLSWGVHNVQQRDVDYTSPPPRFGISVRSRERLEREPAPSGAICL